MKNLESKIIKFISINFISLCFLTFFCFNTYAEDSEIKIDKANIWIDYNELGKAIILLKEAQLYEKVSQSKINTALGRVYFRLGKYEKAQELYESAIYSTSSEDASGYLGLAQAYLESGNLKRAQRYAQSVIKGKELIVEANLVLAEIDARTGYKEKAENRLKNLLVKRPNDEQVAVALSNFLFNYESHTKAILNLENFISTHPNAAIAIEYLSKLKKLIGAETESIIIGFQAANLYEKRGEILRSTILREVLKKQKKQLSVIENNNTDADIKPKEDNEKPSVEETVIDETIVLKEQDKTESKDNDSKAHNEEQKVNKNTEEENDNLYQRIVISKNIENTILKKWWLDVRGNIQNVQNLPFNNKKQIMTGSGFIINEGKYVVSNYHVISDAKTIAVRSGKGVIRGGKKVYYDKKNDLAIIELNEPFLKKSILPISNFIDPLTGSDALVIGYPLTDFVGWQQPSITQGLVTKSSGLIDDPNHILLSSKMNLGNSGGPVVDSKGCLIGIAVAKLDKSLIYKEEGFIPEDINIAIKPSVLSKMFTNINNFGCKLNKNIERTQLYELMLSKVVLVIASE